MKRRRRVVVAALALAACHPQVPSGLDPQCATTQWYAYPVPLYCSAAVPEGWHDEIARQCAWWSDRAQRPLFALTDGEPSEEPMVPGFVYIDTVNATNEGSASMRWWRQLTVEEDSCHLVQVTVALPLLAPDALRAAVVRHEIGHALGLGHSPNPKSPMYPTVGLWAQDQLSAAELAHIMQE